MAELTSKLQTNDFEYNYIYDLAENEVLAVGNPDKIQDSDIITIGSK